MSIDFLVEAVQEAGDLAMHNYEKELYHDMDESHPEVREKSYKELVLEEDITCEEILFLKHRLCKFKL